ncbi:MAG: histidine phosphatase family protein [Planctomycetota bacterium]
MRSDATLLYLLRHGEVDESWRSRIYGCLDVGLSEEGRHQARRSAEALTDVALGTVYASPLQRARFSGELVASGRGLEPVVLPDLREIDRGEWAGRTFSEIETSSPGALAAWHERPDRERPPGGESLTDLETRVVAALGGAIRRDRPTTAAIAAHAWVVRVLVCRALGLPLRDATNVRVRTGSVSVVEWEGGAPRRLLAIDVDRAPRV